MNVLGLLPVHHKRVFSFHFVTPADQLTGATKGSVLPGGEHESPPTWAEGACVSSPGALLLNTGSLCGQSWEKKKKRGGASKVKRRGGTPAVGACKARRRKVPARLLAAACNLLIQRDERRWSADGRTGSYRPCEEPVREDGGGVFEGQLAATQ